jgi:hypothetical protein
VIATGDVNRRNGIVEDREFARQLTEAGVPDSTTRVENHSQVHLAERRPVPASLARGVGPGGAPGRGPQVVPLAGRVQPGHPAPEAAPFYAISSEPAYAVTLVTRAS